MHQEKTHADNVDLAFIPGAERPSAIAMKTERLPFTIRRVEDEESLWKAVRVRQAAYARHTPEFARSLSLPEAADFEDDTIVLLAESRRDGTPVGSTRIRTNTFRPLQVEESVTLPSWLEGRKLLEATRLAVDTGPAARMVKVALIKASVMYCQENKVEWSVAAGRPPIDRHYEQMMFEDVFGHGHVVPLRHAGNIPHRVMANDMTTLHARWTKANHPLLDFFFNTRHPDIDISLKLGTRLAPAAPAEVLHRTRVPHNLDGLFKA
jgi:hypothetical protein